MGTLRSLPILEATSVGQGNDDTDGVKPINSPRSRSRSGCMTESLGERLPEAAPAAVPGRQTRLVTRKTYALSERPSSWQMWQRLREGTTVLTGRSHDFTFRVFHGQLKKTKTYVY